MKITIEGHSGEGKTTIALLIMKKLIDSGFYVTLNDEDQHPFELTEKLQNLRLKSIKPKLIEIHQKNIRRR